MFREYLNELNIDKNIKGKFLINLLNNDFKNKNKSKTKIVRRCILTGRSRSSLRMVGISRIKMKEMICNKKITNIIKQSW